MEGRGNVEVWETDRYAGPCVEWLKKLDRKQTTGDQIMQEVILKMKIA